jgi:long-chain acyl-CoA synthetase
MKKEKTSLLRQGVVDSTYPKLLLRNYQQWGDERLALRKKEHAIWKAYTWKDCYDKVSAMFCGLLAIGMAPEDRVAIIGDSAPEWLWFQLAVQSGRGAVVAINPAASSEKIKYAIGRSNPKFVIAQDQEQVDKLLEIQDTFSFERIIYWNEKGLKHYDNPVLMGMTELLEQGKAWGKEHPIRFEEMVTSGKSDDVAVISYCKSQSPESPLEIRATHDFLLSSAETALAVSNINVDYEYVSLMAPGWFFEQSLGFGTSLLTGQKLNFAENVETSMEDFREISPHSLTYPSSLWDRLAAAIQTNLANSSSLKRIFFGQLLRIGYAINAGNRPPNKLQKLFCYPVDLMGFRPLRDKHGLDNARVAYAAGGTVSPASVRLFQAIGVNVKQIYGSVEDGIVFTDPGENRIDQQFGA